MNPILYVITIALLANALVAIFVRPYVKGLLIIGEWSPFARWLGGRVLFITFLAVSFSPTLLAFSIESIRVVAFHNYFFLGYLIAFCTLLPMVLFTRHIKRNLDKLNNVGFYKNWG